MTEPFDSIRSSARNLDHTSILEKDTSILLGVSQNAAKALKDVGLSTIFDLASSALFADAVDICLLAEDQQGRFASTGKVPRDVLRSDHNTPTSDLPLKPISILKGQTTKPKLETLATVIDVASIRELAAWPPYQTARELLDRAYNPLPITGLLDNESPADLIPANGQYPTERVQYEVLLFDEFVGGKASTRPLEDALDISILLADEKGYEKPALGGILTFTQSWYTKGLALGNLIHGVALGPGESTKIAVIDWSRKTRTSATEAIDEGELLDSDVMRARSISEITHAVARETQSGQSAASSFSEAEQRGESSGAAGFGGGSSDDGTAAYGVGTLGTSHGRASVRSNATSWSTSSGEREIGASMAQDIVDRTHQASHSARNRRASIVREVSQEESESISTRTLTNYNHMHALTIEYYEVVQLYRTVVELSKVDRCLFVPLKLMDFTQPGIVDRFRQVIAANGLRAEVRAWAIAEAKSLLFSSRSPHGPWNSRNSPEFGTNVGSPTDRALILSESAPFGDIFIDANPPFDSLIMTLASGESVKIPLVAGPTDADIQTCGDGDIHNIIDEYLLGLHTTNGGKRTSSCTIGYKQGEIIGKPVDEVRRIEARKRDTSSDFSGTVIVNLIVGRQHIINDPMPCLSWSVDVAADSPSVILFELQPTVTTKELIQHLQDYRLYYSQAIWRSLSPTSVGLLLSGYTWRLGGKDKPLVEFVDPTPVAIIANYLVLRMSGDDEKEKRRWLTKKGITVGRRHEDLVPVPSGGVFAEAVLGRFNSAEKLDITRFWNWQDSPIPVQAPEIAPIPAVSRGEADQTEPGQLGAPVLNIVNSPALPDPQGMGAILAAIQNGNIFRDMSGLAATIGLAQAGLQAAQQGATSAAGQAGQNAATAAELGAKVVDLAGKIAGAYLSGGGTLAAGAGIGELAGLAGGISGQGAKINQGKDMDKRGVSNSQADGQRIIGQTPTGDPIYGATSGGDGAVVTTGSAMSNTSGGGNESAAFNTALGGGRPLLASADAGFVPDTSTGSNAATNTSTVVVLELGGNEDSQAFVSEISAWDVVNATPAAHENYRTIPTPIAEWTNFSQGAPPTWWIERFVAQSPEWVYLSGHYDGILYNENRSYEPNFNNPTAANNQLWRYFGGVNGRPYRLNERCEVVIIMGCNAMAHVAATRNIQRMFSRGTRRPIILGFRQMAPLSVHTDRLVTRFIENLSADWENRYDDEHLTDSWLAAGREWNANLGRRLGYLGRNGTAYEVDSSGADWEWSEI